MTRPELARLRLSNQYLLRAGERMEVLRAMNGLQAQFLSNALHAMRLRSTAYDAAHAADGLVKGWTLRGTMHIFAEADLPLFLHSGCRYRSRDWTVPSFWNQRPDWALTPQRQTYFSDLIVDVLTQGLLTREALKDRCRAAGMTQAEEDSMFHPWGGGIRELCERGFLCGTVSEEKAFRLCPAFIPMEEQDALLEQTRRYFTNYGPASVRDAAYYFCTSQAEIKKRLARLPVEAAECEGQRLFSLDSGRAPGQSLPGCLLLAGFDPLMLGYEKKQSVFLPPEYLRGIFSLSGIVMPPVLLRGVVAGRWKRSGKRLLVMCFRPFSREERGFTEVTAARLWGEAVQVVFQDA